MNPHQLPPDLKREVEEAAMSRGTSRGAYDRLIVWDWIIILSANTFLAYVISRLIEVFK